IIAAVFILCEVRTSALYEEIWSKIIELFYSWTVKRAVINVQSTDNACFAWSVVAALHPAQKNVERESSYPHYSSVLNLQDIQFPMTLSQIKKFEALNDISINVYAIEKGIVPIRLTDRKRSKHVNLLYVEDQLTVYRFRRDKDCIAWFAEELRQLALSVQSVISANVPMADFTRDDWEKFNSVSHCHVCEKPFIPDDTWVRDHCHLTGRYRGPANSNCNLNYRESRCIPVVFHNLSGYDDHFIIKEIATAYEGRVDLVPITKEKYISFTKHVDSTKIDQKNCVQLRFIDSYRFLALSLDKLSFFLNNDKERELRREFSHLSEEKFNLLTRKGVFPYEYIDCSEKLNEAMIAKPNFHSRSVFSENLVAIELPKLEVKFDKPIYEGMCILDISKTCLYEFHHEYMAPVFREKCKIMYTDTDSLIYHVECDDIYDVMKRDINRFDTSDYAVDNAYSIPLANKKVPGLMKDENNGSIMTEFVGLRAKMYALRVQGKKDAKKAKGVKRSVVAKSITFEDYTCCLNDAIESTRRQSCIRSKLHEVYTISETKITLNPHDDKRYIVSGSTDTLPWGHYRCK
ncbi:hypothetical protein ALC57_04921, partial [Trachymyrmex cornetzi]